MFEKIRVGTCGFGRTKRPDYFKMLEAVEIQHTFYQPPQIETLGKWQEAAPPDFEFTLKAWQMITHESSSPTYRRMDRPLTEEEERDAGFFRPNDAVAEAWRVTLDSAKALQAKIVLFQCPARLQPLPENILNMKRFFAEIDRGGMDLAWEPRGKLWEDELVEELCRELDLWHCVDPFQRRTMTPERCYYRLHGRRRWRYTYEEDELFELAALLPSGARGYIFFNNITMKDDAVRFRKILDDQAQNL